MGSGSWPSPLQPPTLQTQHQGRPLPPRCPLKWAGLCAPRGGRAMQVFIRPVILSDPQGEGA